MKDPQNISRREVIKWSVPLFAAAAIPGVIQLTSCSSKKDSNTANNQHPRKPKKTPAQRGNPYAGRDEMFLHNKTKTLHYPYVFKTYDKLKEEHFTNVNTSDWEKQLDENSAHFTTEKSALIFEKLALKNLAGEINNEKLNRSAAILGRSFTTDYAKQNIHNWRGYQLLLQLIALNSSVPDNEKWTGFGNIIRDVNVSQVKKVPRQNAWVTSQQLFDQRVQYIHQHSEEYMNRIKKRTA